MKPDETWHLKPAWNRNIFDTKSWAPEKRAGQMNWLKSKANLILKASQRQYRQFMPIHNYLNHLNLTPKEMVFEYVWIYLNTRVNLWCLQKLRDADFRGAKDHVPVYSWSLHSYRHEHLSRPVHRHSPGRTLAHGHKRLQQDLPAHTLSYIIIHYHNSFWFYSSWSLWNIGIELELYVPFSERIPWPKAHIHRVRNERDLWWAVAYGMEAGQQSVVGQSVWEDDSKMFMCLYICIYIYTYK